MNTFRIFIDNQWLTAFLVNFFVIAFGQRFPFLTKKGWLHAAALGTILWGSIGWQGWLSVCGYLLLGTVVTKVGFKEKEKKGIAEARGGKRGPENVWGSAATGCSLAMLSCTFPEHVWILMVGFSASFAAKLADTFGSELGKSFGKNVFLITTLKAVRPGTEGAISLEGLFASLCGSFIMTLVMYNLSLISGYSTFFIVTLSGLFATIFESYIGALYQIRFKFLTNELVNSIQTTFAAMLAILLSLLLI